MSKSKRKHHRKNHTPAFYESLPAATIAPAGLPQVGDQLNEAFDKFNDSRRAAAVKLRPVVKQAMAKFLRGASIAFAAITLGWERVFAAARYSADAAVNYAPPFIGDFAAYTARGWHRATNRRARALYLMVAASAAFAIVAIAAVTATATLHKYANDISSPAAILAKKKTGTTILDRNGQVLFQGFGAQSTEQIKLKDVPDSLKQATLAAEDPNFYQHPAISWRGTIRAAFIDITHQGAVEGGSTLTQQLVKNSLLNSDKNITRKFNEILLATELEKHYSKDQILEMYLNETYYGQGSNGVEAASEAYFHKSAKDLTLGESAMLAGLPLGPSRFDPNADLSAATGRRDYVLSRMAELGKITKAQADAAKAQPIVLADKTGDQPGAMNVHAKSVFIKAPHFVFYVLDQLRAKYGENTLENGGITVRTTLDLNKQQLAEQSVKAHIDALAGHHVTNGALISIKPDTGDIMAMVGSVDYNAPGFGNVNATLSQLQPGSSFKPIAYATAFKKGWTGATVIRDEPFSAPSGDGTMYTPMNYDLKWHGDVTVRKALDNSLNIPAVKTLQFAGIPDTLKTAHDMGITTLNDPNRYGLALVLGGGEVRPLDMATVYATFDNGGVKVAPRSILKVEDREGKDITKADPQVKQSVLDPRIAYMITNILSDDHSRQPEFPAGGPLTLPGRPAAAKTGTTNDFRDNWTVGYTPQLVTAVWVGNNDHSAMQNVDGITGAAPIWHDYMSGALAGQPVINFSVPSGVTIAKVDDHGCLSPAGHDEVFKSDAMPTNHCGGSTQPTPTPTDNSGDQSAQPAATFPEPTPSPTPTPQPSIAPGSGGGPTPSPTPTPQASPTPPAG